MSFFFSSCFPAFPAGSRMKKRLEKNEEETNKMKKKQIKNKKYMKKQQQNGAFSAFNTSWVLINVQYRPINLQGQLQTRCEQNKCMLGQRR